MASRISAKIGPGEGPWVVINPEYEWKWEVAEPLGCKLFAECVDTDEVLTVVEVFNDQTLPPAVARVKVKAANATAALTVTLVRVFDASAPD